MSLLFWVSWACQLLHGLEFVNKDIFRNWVKQLHIFVWTALSTTKTSQTVSQKVANIGIEFTHQKLNIVYRHIICHLTRDTPTVAFVCQNTNLKKLKPFQNLNQFNPWTNWSLEPIQPLNQFKPWPNSTLEPIDPVNHSNPWTNLILTLIEPLKQSNPWSNSIIEPIEPWTNWTLEPV